MLYLRNFILNESWKTYTPSKNPKILLYDFYVLSYLSTLPLDSSQKGFSGTFVGRNASEVKLDIEHAQSVLLPLMVKQIKNALFLAICAETRHVFDRNSGNDFNLLNKLNDPNDVNEFNIGDIVSAENGTVNGIVVDMDHAGDDPFYTIKITSVDTEANKKYSSGVVNTKISYYPKDLTLIKPAVVKEIPSVKNENSTHTLNTDGVPMVPGRLYTYGNNLVFKLLHLLTDSYLGMKMAEVENIKTKAHVSIPIDELSYDYTSNIAFDANGDDISIAKYYKYNYVGVYAGTLIVYPKNAYANTNGGAQSPRITCEVVQVFTANPPHAVGSRIVVTPYRLVPVSDEQI